MCGVEKLIIQLYFNVFRLKTFYVEIKINWSGLYYSPGLRSKSLEPNLFCWPEFCIKIENMLATFVKNGFRMSKFYQYIVRPIHYWGEIFLNVMFVEKFLQNLCLLLYIVRPLLYQRQIYLNVMCVGKYLLACYSCDNTIIFKCNVCGKVFTCLLFLWQHNKKTHIIQKLYFQMLCLWESI